MINWGWGSEGGGLGVGRWGWGNGGGEVVVGKWGWGAGAGDGVGNWGLGWGWGGEMGVGPESGRKITQRKLRAKEEQ